MKPMGFHHEAFKFFLFESGTIEKYVKNTVSCFFFNTLIHDFFRFTFPTLKIPSTKNDARLDQSIGDHASEVWREGVGSDLGCPPRW